MEPPSERPMASTSYRAVAGPSRQRSSKESKERCRTCQRRKVRCDKRMPVCSNCERLKLECEPVSKNKWKDVTQSTRRAVSSITSEKRSVWDSGRAPLEPHEFGPPVDNEYSALENVAALERPGTFFVNSTPGIFSSPEKNDAFSDIASSFGNPATIPATSMIMERFEDYGYGSSNATPSRRSYSIINVASTLTAKVVDAPAVSVNSGPSLSSSTSLANRLGSSTLVGASSTLRASMFSRALIGARDLQYYNHYRAVVVYNMQINSRFPSSVKPYCHAEGETEDPFETAAASFSPLYHAMLALSALSLANRERLDRIDSLQHYQLAVQGLQDFSTLESLNIIYTHYFLLLYEVAACEQQRANLELSHIGQLIRLIGWFFTTAQNDPASAFRDQSCSKCAEVAMTCIPSNLLYCDIYNLMMGRISQVLVPDIMVCGFFNSVSEGLTKDWHLEAAFKQHADVAYKMVSMNILGGWAFRVLRITMELINQGIISTIEELNPRLDELDEKILTIRDWCNTNSPPLPRDMNDITYIHLPMQCQTYFDSSQYTIRTILIFAYTSILPKQRSNLSAQREQHVQALAREILQLTRPRWGSLRPIAATNLISLFMCGTVIDTADEKAEILSVIQKLGTNASGRNFGRAVAALKELWQVQANVKAQGGDEKDVDWRIILKERGLLDFSMFGL